MDVLESQQSSRFARFCKSCTPNFYRGGKNVYPTFQTCTDFQFFLHTPVTWELREKLQISPRCRVTVMPKLRQQAVGGGSLYVQ